VQNIINIITMTIMGAFFSYLGFCAFKYMMLTISKSQVYNVTRVPYAVIILALVVGSVFCLIFSISQIIQLFAQRKELKGKNTKEVSE